MDFRAAAPIRRAMQSRLDHGVFGYSIVPQQNYDAVSHWFARRHGWHGISRENLLYATAVVPAISAIFAALKTRIMNADTTRQRCTPLRILTFTPAYNCFFACIENMGCELVASPLVLKDNRFEINWEDIEQKALRLLVRNRLLARAVLNHLFQLELLAFHVPEPYPQDHCKQPQDRQRDDNPKPDKFPQERLLDNRHVHRLSRQAVAVPRLYHEPVCTMRQVCIRSGS
jgi:hypothetical protein